METGLPPAFKTLRDYIRNDLKLIANLEMGSPNYAAALLIAVATEALSKLLGQSDEHVFVNEVLGKYHVPPVVGRVLFNAVRNGLAHLYETKVVVLNEQQESWTLVVISWETIPHLTVVEKDWLNDGVKRQAVCLNIQTMWGDLDAYIGQLETQLRENPHFRHAMVTRVHSLELTIPIEGEAVRVWNDFVKTNSDAHTI